MKNFINLNYLSVQKRLGLAVKKTFDINGFLVNKDHNTVKVDIGNRVIEAVLKNPIKENVGNHILIDKSNIISMKICDKSEELKTQHQNSYEETLKMYGIESNNETLESFKTLEKFNVPVDKNAIETLIATQKYFDTIKQNLTYDMTIKLIDKSIDVEHDSIQKVADAVEEIKAEDEISAILKFLNGRKELTTEQAQEIARKIYGSSMGKDITNIIKSLYKEGTNITKNTIEEVYNVFYKLDKLEGVETDNFVELYKKGNELTIENLYNQKQYVKEGSIPAEEGVSAYATAVYEENTLQIKKTEEKDLCRMDEKIRFLLKDMNIEPTEETMKLAKEMIRKGTSLTKENINEILAMKKALKDLIEKFNIEDASKMLKRGMNLEKTDIREMAKLIGELTEGKSEQVKNMVDHIDRIKEIQIRLENLKEIKDTDLVKLLKNKVEFQLNKIEKVVFHQKPQNQSMYLKDHNRIDYPVKKGVDQIYKVSQIFHKIKTLDFNQIASHVSKGIIMTLKTIGDTYEGLKGTNNEINKTDTQQINNYLNTYKEDLNEISQPLAQIMDASKALLQNKVGLSISNMQYAFEAYGQYNRIRTSLTSKMIMDSIQEKEDLYNMKLEALDSYVMKKVLKGDPTNTHQESFKEESSKYEEVLNDEPKIKLEGVKELVGNITKIGKEEMSILPLMINNHMDLSLKEMESMSFLLKNQQQLGQKIGEVLQFLGNVQDPKLREELLKLERLSKDLSRRLKNGIPGIGKAYHELLGYIEDMQKEKSFSEEGNKELKKQMEDMRASLQMQKKINKKNFLQQLPIIVGNEIKNLQIYVPPTSMNKETRNMPLTVLMNLDTNNLGQIHMALKINKKEVDLAIGVEANKGKEQLKKQVSFLEEMLHNGGYTLKDVSFKVKDDIYLTEEMKGENKRRENTFLDITL
ncbi:DUF6240 domain-containing protein [Marinisporobacter balticus]|uniref:Flagellar hook-length control protein FliK n=1 Tax=Marinisporobacter balticus TaxID=2018667 RepID=A0A4R2KUF8_9FIRM|nr:DUF6240 domain-containing protein [Marinisporobacter balticus]TCO76447.1 flagellar hook-length control protein FliK [Marinisporobacter balticus]